MPISVFEMFRVGVGPSSSHTVGPMRAALQFVQELKKEGVLDKVARLRIELMGSLGATGKGHATDKAVMLGLSGIGPENPLAAEAESFAHKVRESGKLTLAGEVEVPFGADEDIVFSPEKVARFHTNAMQLAAADQSGNLLLDRRFYSTGGGFVLEADPGDFESVKGQEKGQEGRYFVPFNYKNATELVGMAQIAGMSIAEVVRLNERAASSDEVVNQKLDGVWSEMSRCIDRGLANTGVLPGILSVKRRASRLAKHLQDKDLARDPMVALDWVNAWALAVSEENAAGGRIVTCPTNGAAGVVPAVLKYLTTFVGGTTMEQCRDYLLVAGAVGMLFKENASISGAEVGCQGEVGVACSMAAAGLAAALGGTPNQIENAAEIGMEHNLGMTCDPVGGQVQIPCIERNAVAAVKAINAARIALVGDGSHFVSLDKVMQTMVETGRDMQAKYKETSRGGLAISIMGC